MILDYWKDVNNRQARRLSHPYNFAPCSYAIRSFIISNFNTPFLVLVSGKHLPLVQFYLIQNLIQSVKVIHSVLISSVSQMKSYLNDRRTDKESPDKGGWIWTVVYRSRSPMPYRLATPPCLHIMYVSM